MARLKSGDLAPAFSGLTYDGKRVDLNDFSGKRLWLAFLRTGCPVSKAFIESVRKHQNEFDEFDVAFVAVFEEHPSRVATISFAERAGLPSLICDPERSIFRAYGTERGLSYLFHPWVALTTLTSAMRGFFPGPLPTLEQFKQAPAHFLIDEEGLVKLTHYGTHVSDHLPWWKVRRFARQGFVYVPAQSEILVEAGGSGQENYVVEPQKRRDVAG